MSLIAKRNILGLMKTIQLALKDFPAIPYGLFDDNGHQVEELSFSVDEIYVHYWLAKYGDHPNPPLGTFEFMHQICSCDEWRMKGDGIGRGTEAKRNISNELAKGFARWFMYTYLGHTYFAPFEHAVQAPPNADGHYWLKVGEGDAPDYVCGSGPADVNILEVKGRYSSVTFDTQEFETFREQVARARLLDSSDTEIGVKSFIFAARWATESHPNVQPKLWVEDPWTPGSRERRRPDGVGAAMIRGHYADLIRRMGIYELAEALLTGVPFNMTVDPYRIVWRCREGTHAGRLFVGFSPTSLWWSLNGTLPQADKKPPWGVPFLGLDLKIFLAVISAARAGGLAADFLVPLNLQDQQSASADGEHDAVVLLRDGVAAGTVLQFDAVDILNINALRDQEGPPFQTI